MRLLKGGYSVANQTSAGGEYWINLILLRGAVSRNFSRASVRRAGKHSHGLQVTMVPPFAVSRRILQHPTGQGTVAIQPSDQGFLGPDRVVRVCP